jgi:hypothetical protein
VIGLLLLLTPFLDAFWERDLGALHRELQENRAGEQRELFADLLRLVSCDPLDKLTGPDPLRALVRVEEARRGTPGTIWSDVLREDFFRRKVWNPEEKNSLVWPDEEERWPGEVLRVGPVPSNCGKAAKGAGPLPLLTPELVKALPPEPAARAAYERAILLWRKGGTDGAAAVEVQRLHPNLRPAARFLRLEAKLDPPEGWIALAAEWPQLAVVTRAAAELLRQRRYQEVLLLTGTVELPEDATRAEMVRAILWTRALALQALGRDPEMLEVLARARSLPGKGKGQEAMRALAMSALARQPVDPARLEAFSGAAGRDAAWMELAHRALAAGNLQTARDAALQLQGAGDPRSRAQGLALAGEIGWASGEVKETQAALERLFAERLRVAERESRDSAALQLAHAIVLREAESSTHRDALKTQLAWLRERLSIRDAAQIEALVTSLQSAAVEGEQRLALGRIDVVRAPEPPPEPPVLLDLPEPPSLLAIPGPDGAVHDWFEARGPP